jgi:nicotinate dehydrogenase subunit A
MRRPALTGLKPGGMFVGFGTRTRTTQSMPLYRLNVNGQPREVTVEADTPLLYVLRNDLELNGAKYGCGLGQCGACAVLIDGQPARSCVIAAGTVGEKPVTTLEGLGTPDAPHPLQKAFIEEQAMQCGYCINGMILTAKALLDRNRHPDADAIRAALDGNLCRCGSHNRIVRAIERAAREMAG